MYQTETHLLENQESPVRLSDIAGGLFSLIPSRKGMKKAIDKGWVTVNGNLAQTGDFVAGGETIVLTIPSDTTRLVLNLKMSVLYEDDFLAVVNKPAGIEVSGNRKHTVENALPFNLQRSSQLDAIEPQAIHRLDYPTTGSLLVGKTRTAVSRLNKLFLNREIAKVYLTVTIGEMKPRGEINLPIGGRPSASSYTVLETVNSGRFNALNLVQVVPGTGRRHQIRKHLSSIGNPILGDKGYGQDGLILKGKGLYLHSKSLAFKHPYTNEHIRVEAPLPKKFLKLFP